MAPEIAVANGPCWGLRAHARTAYFRMPSAAYGRVVKR